jgi:acyl carrier protein
MPTLELHAERVMEAPARDVSDSFSLRNIGTIALVTAQLALTLLVVHEFRLESRTFFEVLLLATGGFVVHALLPMRHRLAFFVLLSAASIVLALGLRDGGFVLLLGLVLIAVCHLPIRLPLRALLLLGIGVLFAVFRVGKLSGPWSLAIWPVLGSMFMFRLVVYLYAMRYENKRPTPAQAFAYFFMLPNVCFPLYPVVDYATFVRAYYDREALTIYETGVKWIVRGLVHLILYRFVYLYLAGDPEQLATLGDLVQFVLATYLLYLRVSGQFHVIAGVLHLFGFRLPETHHLYYLASSFTDFWRRINIYWKDFMMKLVYYPSFFRLRRFGGNLALVAATAIVFVATWVLHSYQWFWLRGGFPLALQDAAFWAILGAFVVAGSLREMKSPRKRRLGAASVWSASLAFRTVRFFAVMCVLWSLWSAESVSAWITMWIVAGNVAPGDLWLLAGLLAGGLLIAGHEWSVKEDDDKSRPLLLRPAFQSTAVLAGLLLLGSTQLYARQGPRLAATVESLQRSTLNARDAALQHKGYYENLDNSSRMSAQLWDVQAQKPPSWVGLSQTEASRDRDDFLGGDLKPGGEHHLPGQAAQRQPLGDARPRHDAGEAGRNLPDRDPRPVARHGLGCRGRRDVLRRPRAAPQPGRRAREPAALRGAELRRGRLHAVPAARDARGSGLRLPAGRGVRHGQPARPGADGRATLQPALPPRRDSVSDAGHAAPRLGRDGARRRGRRRAVPERALGARCRGREDAHAVERGRTAAADERRRPRRLVVRRDRGVPAPARRAGGVRRARQRRRPAAEGEGDRGPGAARRLPGVRPLRSVGRPRPAEPAHRFGRQPPERRRDAAHRRAAAGADPAAPGRAADRRGGGGGTRFRQGGLAMSDDVRATVKEFVLREFLPGEDPAELTEATPLITGGVLDSIATLKLVLFVEERFGITLEAHEVSPEHINTVADIARLVDAKKAKGGRAGV